MYYSIIQISEIKNDKILLVSETVFDAMYYKNINNSR